MIAAARWLALVALVGAVGCAEEEGRFPVVVTTETDDGQPLADLPVTVGKTAAGRTDATGKLKMRVVGKEGARIAITVATPKGYRPASAANGGVILRRLGDIEGGGEARAAGDDIADHLSLFRPGGGEQHRLGGAVQMWRELGKPERLVDSRELAALLQLRHMPAQREPVLGEERRGAFDRQLLHVSPSLVRPPAAARIIKAGGFRPKPLRNRDLQAPARQDLMAAEPGPSRAPLGRR